MPSRAAPPLFERYGIDSAPYTRQAEKYRAAVAASFRGDRFIRGYFDDGQVIGAKGCGQCEIDAISQGFAALVLKNEDAATGIKTALRELFEETGLTAEKMILAGQIFFYSDEYEDECMYLYRAEGLFGNLSDCDEGTLEWIEKERIQDLPMWEGDRIFLELFWDKAPFFTMSLTYEKDRLINHKTRFEALL